MLEKFYAVTETSIYEITRPTDGSTTPVVTKINLKADSPFLIGHQLKGGSVLAICNRLIMFIPEGSGSISPTSTVERKIEMVNTHYWGNQSSQIIGLFGTQLEAEYCFKHDDGQPCDSRWIENTIAVLKQIPNDDLGIVVCDFPDLRLLPKGISVS